MGESQALPAGDLVQGPRRARSLRGYDAQSGQSHPRGKWVPGLELGMGREFRGPGVGVGPLRGCGGNVLEGESRGGRTTCSVA